MLTLYGYSISRSSRCEWLLKELDVPYQFVFIDLINDEQYSPKFLAINPYGKVPVLVDNNVKIFESAAICNYLAEKYPEKNMIPKAGTVEKAYYDQWMFFIMTELDQPLWSIVKHTFIYPPERMLEEARSLAADDFKGAARILNRHLKDRKYILGDDFSVVDIILGHTLAWAYGYDVMMPFQMLKDFPHLRFYLRKLSDRPAMPDYLRERCLGL